MCDVCQSLYGHLKSCSEMTTENKIACLWCENKLDIGETVITFPNKKTFCKNCVKDFDLSDLLLNSNTQDCFDLVEKFSICEIYEIGSATNDN